MVGRWRLFEMTNTTKSIISTSRRRLIGVVIWLVLDDIADEKLQKQFILFLAKGGVGIN